MWNIVQYRGLYFLFSAIIILGGISTLFMGPGLSLSIEFKGGAAVRAEFSQPVTQEEVEKIIYGQLQYENGIIQSFGNGEFLIRLPLSEDAGNQENEIRTGLEQLSPLNMNFDQVSPTIAKETVVNAIIAIGVAVLGILAFIIYAFRGVAHSFRYGVSAILALAHDILVAIAVAGVASAFFGNFFRLEISSMFLVGVLTLLGYSINDTIVIFDRIRENLLRETHTTLEETVNFSILESMGRSINTSFTTLVVLLALLLVGPISIFDFIFVMIIGVISGTYSSIFTASQVLVSWETRSLGRMPFSNKR